MAGHLLSRDTDQDHLHQQSLKLTIHNVQDAEWARQAVRERERELHVHVPSHHLRKIKVVAPKNSLTESNWPIKNGTIMTSSSL
mmetsp:Transcript_24120/g.41302  ORF Transcript_24120/g.41302 Transcript_24120/m.41302 type:complete len:84 (+) Transcript_24120:148-399(+)